MIKERKILFVTDKDNDEINCSIFSQLFSLNEIQLDISNKLENISKQYETVIVDQFIDNKLSTDSIIKHLENSNIKYVYLLISRMLSEKEEEIINSNKISILSMPINQAEVFNRIINVT